MWLRTTAYLSPAEVKFSARPAWVFQLNHDDDEVIRPGTPAKAARDLF